MKLGHKLILFALLCSVVPLLGVSTLAFNAARSSLGEIVENNLRASAEQELIDLKGQLIDARGHLVTWGRLGIMQDVMVDDSDGDLQSELVRFQERYAMFAELMVVNRSGVVIAATESGMIETDLSDSAEFSAPITGIEHQGSAEFSTRLGKTAITFGIPIRASYNESTVIGSLVGSLDWEKIQLDLASRTVFGGKQDDQRLIVLQSRANGAILYSTGESQWSNEFLISISSKFGVSEQRVNEVSYVVASARTTETGILRDLNWVLHVVLSTDFAYSSVKSLFNYMLVIGGAALLLVTLLGFFLARAMVKPINALAEGAEGLAAGDYDSPLPKYTNKDEIGVLTNSFVAMRDAIKINEQELIKRTEISEEAARLKGEFLANMSHEVRTPINGVLGMTELLMNTQLDQTQARYASTISRSGQSLLSVINDILDFSKIEAGKLELQDSAFDLREVVDDVLELVAESAHKKGIEISAHLSPDAHIAYQGDASRLRQILINLLGNAIKFTSEGEVKLSVTSEDSESNQTLLRFEVIDTGIGIAAEAQSSIFESFVQADGTTTRKYGGTGLGLAISAQLSELMKGDIGVTSQPGKGSTFWFAANVEKLPGSVTSAWRDSHSLKGKRILIVDDNKTNREILQAQVEYWRADYLLAEGGQEALSALRGACKDNNPFDLAILDMHMPGMDGLALTVAIKDDEALAKTRLILLSSVCDKLDVESYRAIGLESVLTKPVRQSELFQCLSAVIVNNVVELTPSSEVRKMAFSKLCGRVLIAEDNPVNQELISEIMGLMGIDFHLVGNGQEALEILSTERFDAVLMDCQMPVMDGFEATRAIRQREKEQNSSCPVPIIALTANALQGDREICLEAGMDEYLTKPVSSNQLHEMLSRWLQESRDDLTPKKPSVDNSASATVTPITAAPITAAPKLEAEVPEGPGAEELDDAPLDSAAFAEIMAISSQASSGFLARLTQKFVDNSASDIEKLDAMVTDTQSDDIRKLAHSLKSSSANLGAKNLAALCQVLESDAASCTSEQMIEQITAIKLERDRVIEALNIECQRAA